MTHSFEKDYWEQHWVQAGRTTTADRAESTANPYLVRETSGLAPGTALDAGCGTGAEALWLAGQGWSVIGADISAAALGQAAERAATVSRADRVTWVQADLTTWEPDGLFDLVVTNYAHPAIPQLAFYDRIADWVAPGGTLLIVGHLHHVGGPAHTHDGPHEHNGAHQDTPHHVQFDHGDEPPVEATVTLADITGRLDPRVWRIDTAEEHTRPAGQGRPLHDVVVRASRLA